MRANALQTVIILLRSSLCMASICCYGLFLGLLGRLTRQRANARLQQWAAAILKPLNVSLSVFNDNPSHFSKPRPYIIMSNHASLYDIPIIYHALQGKTIRMIGKRELFRIPVFGQAMRAAEVPSIDRHNRQQAIKDLAFAREKMEDGIIIWMAPEGTRSRDGKLQALKKGGFIMAIQADAIIVPVGIRHANKILPSKTWQFHLDQEVEVHIGEEIDAKNYTLDDKEALIEQVKQQLHQLADA